MGYLRKCPFLVILMAIGALAMFVPAMVAGAQQDYVTARPFLYGAILFLMLTAAVSLATVNRPPPQRARGHLLSLGIGFVLLPLMLAVPFSEAVPDTRFINVYVEMVSCLTTTGATLFDPDRLPLAIHIWRGLVAWLGGFLMWVAAFAVLAPMTLGGFEVTSEHEAGRGTPAATLGDRVQPSERLRRFALQFAPIYVTLTVVLWVGLIMSGSPPGSALIHAMSTLSTSGITAGGTVGANGGGAMAEILIFVFLFFAVSRRTFQGGVTKPMWAEISVDRELRIAILFIVAIPTFLFLRHWLGAFEVNAELDQRALPALWGGMFMVLSFLTTSGFVSDSWQSAQNWSGLGTPGLLLAGVAVFGGGVATTAGGVKLLRVYALYKHGVREVEKLVHPSSIGGAGPMARRIRREGAAIAWIFFMLFAISLAVIMAALALCGLSFEQATILAIAALSTTGPIAVVATEAPISYAMLPDAAKMILAFAMVLGRLETLAVVALLNPDFWRG